MQISLNTTMHRPSVQEAVSMGRVMVVAVPVQDSRETKPDMEIRAARETREVTTIRGTNSSSNRVIRAIQNS